MHRHTLLNSTILFLFLYIVASNIEKEYWIILFHIRVKTAYTFLNFIMVLAFFVLCRKITCIFRIYNFYIFRRTLSRRGLELLEKLERAGIGKRPVIWVGHSMGGKIIFMS